MSRWLKATLASSAFALLCLSSYFPWEVRAEDIVIRDGPLSEGIPFITTTRYISWRGRINGDGFGPSTFAFNEQNQFLNSTCALPCGPDSRLTTNTDGHFTATSMASILHLNGQSYDKWFRGSEIKFSLDRILIPIEPSRFTKATDLTKDKFDFDGHNPQTEFEPVTMIPFGNSLESFAARFHRHLSTPNSQLRTSQALSNLNLVTESFKSSRRTRLAGRELVVWQREGLQRLFEPKIPIQFWRRIELNDKRIVPASRLPIRGETK